MNEFVSLVLAATLLLPSMAAAQDGRGLSVLEGAAERYAGAETLCANFTQRLSVPLLGEERTGLGRLCQARPNRFAMHFSEPEGDRVVLDGESAWVYYPSLDEKQVLKMPMAEGGGGQDFHREFLEDPATKYEVSYEAEDLVDERPTHRLRLVPKTDASYHSAVLWIDVGTPVLRRIRLEEENGTVRTITLSDVRLDSSPPPGWFTFTPPAGALVISG